MKIYTAREVAEILKVQETTVLKWLLTKKIRGFKIGKSWRIEELALEEFFEQMKKGE